MRAAYINATGPLRSPSKTRPKRTASSKAIPREARANEWARL
jgi:hypothetical protein